MEDELNKVISDEQYDQLIGRIREAHEEGVLKIRDWMGMYELLVDAYEREKAETYERIMMDSFRDSDEESGDGE